MIWSVSPFLNEVDVLEIRLSELDSVVDVFVISEATHTHSNIPRELVFPQVRERFSHWQDKIRYLPVEFPPLGEDDWVRENYQREYLGRGLEGLHPDDIVIISDVDEIISAETVVRLSEGKFRIPCTFSFPIHPYRLDWKWETLDEGCERCTVIHGSDLSLLPNGFYQGVQSAIALSFCCFTDPGFTGPQPTRFCLDHNHYLGEYGWHFTYQGDEEKILAKAASIADVWVKDVATAESAAAAISTGADLFGRSEKSAQRVSLDQLPVYVQENAEKFSHILTPQALPVAAGL